MYCLAGFSNPHFIQTAHKPTHLTVPAGGRGSGGGEPLALRALRAVLVRPLDQRAFLDGALGLQVHAVDGDALDGVGRQALRSNTHLTWFG